METEIKPLHPLDHGNILLVGMKASNLDDELKNHPRVIVWDNQNGSWTDKDIPNNVQAIFITRFIGHTIFGKILKEARKKRITLFNPMGTGIIVRQVKELLSIRPPFELITELSAHTITETKQVTTEVKKHQTGGKAKLHALIPFINWDDNNVVNAQELVKKAQELGIDTTQASLANFVGVERRKLDGRLVINPRPKRLVETKKEETKDVSVEILDNLINEMQEVRKYLIATVKENVSLRARIEKFKKVLDND